MPCYEEQKTDMKNMVPADRIRPDALLGKRIAVLGYGNQGRPQALNLRDSGFDVVIGHRSHSRGFDRATEDGFSVLPIAEAASLADVMMLTLPDQVMGDVFNRDIWPSLKEGQTLLFSHGFAIHFGTLSPPLMVGVGLVAPKGAGTGVRNLFEAGSGVPGLVAVHQDPFSNVLDIALAYAYGVGCGRQFVIKTTFEEETVTDLFGEQAVLCGGIPALIEAGFQTLVEAGYAPEVAYFECLHETKLIVDLIVARGLTGMRQAISDTAEWGGYQVGSTLINEDVRSRLREVLANIQQGSFAEGWILEANTGSPNLQQARNSGSHAAIEEVGAEVRSHMKP